MNNFNHDCSTRPTTPRLALGIVSYIPGLFIATSLPLDNKVHKTPFDRNMSVRIAAYGTGYGYLHKKSEVSINYFPLNLEEYILL